jgi:hypothetical protein
MGLKVNTIWFDSGTRTFLGSLRYYVNDRYGRGKEVQSRLPPERNHFLKNLFRPLLWAVDRLGLGDLMYLEVGKA